MLICDNLLQYKRYTLFLREEVEGFYVEFGTKRRDGRYNFNEKIILSLYKDEMDEDLRIRLGKYIYNPKTKQQDVSKYIVLIKIHQVSYFSQKIIN